MSDNTIDAWIREENGHQPSLVDQILTAYWFYRNNIVITNDVDRRTAEVSDALEERLDHEVDTALDNLAEIGVLEKFEPPTRVFIQNERTNKAFFSTADENFPPNLYHEISRLVYDIHLQEGRDGEGGFPQRLSRPELTPATDGGDVDSETDDDDHLSLRQFVATELDVEVTEVEQALVEPVDPVECMEQFDNIVTAIKESDEVTRGLDYDRVGWRHRANRWTLSKTAQRVEVNESLPV